MYIEEPEDKINLGAVSLVSTDDNSQAETEMDWFEDINDFMPE